MPAPSVHGPPLVLCSQALCNALQVPLPFVEAAQFNDSGMGELGFMAAHTARARLGLMVGGVHYRQPGLWAKAATTLDVLSGGRAWLGIGAAWNEDESNGLGFPFPPLAERFVMLEDTLRLVHEMWQGERGSEAALDTPYVHATRLLNSPQAISRPHPPIMIGGGGEKKTLRLVAQYADACNVFGGPEAIHHKYEVLREHCDSLGRNPDEIERSTLQNVKLATAGRTGESPAQVVDRFGELSDAGAQHVIFSVRDDADPAVMELLATKVLPELRAL